MNRERIYNVFFSYVPASLAAFKIIIMTMMTMMKIYCGDDDDLMIIIVITILTTTTTTMTPISATIFITLY